MAKDVLKKAEINNENELYDVGVMLSYTSMFHCARSILFQDGIKEHSHICIVLYLKQGYPKLTRFINNLDSYRRMRHTAIYDLESRIGKEDAELAHYLAKEFIEEIEYNFQSSSEK